MENFTDEYYKSKTREAVNLRIGAGVIDYLLVFGLTLGYMTFFGEKLGPAHYKVTGIKAAVPFLLWAVYFIFFEKLLEGSLGNRMMGLRVISQDGNRISFAQVLKRRIADIIDIWWCFGLLGYLLLRNTIYNQRHGDLWGRTIVVKQ